ncbi:MAG: hypothetical protein AB7I38_08235 [Dehalococcoidia bacterium]
MPRFIDRHAVLPVPPAAGLEQLRARVEAPADEHGVKGVNILFAEDGSGYCIFDAPDAGAVVRAHEGSGLTLTDADVVQITPLI